MNVLSDDQKSVTLIPSILALNQTLDMTLYVITDYKLENSTSANAGIRMKIRMKRKILSEIMTTYFPSLLLMMITYATTFFKPFFFEAALSVNLTTMLVMTTIFISKMESLPPTSDIKMIDCWLILCQLVPFTQVVLLTAMEYLREKDAEEKEEEMKEVWPNVAPIKEGRDQDSSSQNDLEEEDGIEALTLDQPMNTKVGLVRELVLVGEYYSLDLS